MKKYLPSRVIRGTELCSTGSPSPGAGILRTLGERGGGVEGEGKEREEVEEPELNDGGVIESVDELGDAGGDGDVNALINTIYIISIF